MLHARIALDVKNAIAHEQIVVEFLRAADIQDRVGFAIELPDFFQRQAGGRITRQIARAKGPAIFEIEFARQAVENFCRVIEIVGDFEGFRVVGKPR